MSKYLLVIVSERDEGVVGVRTPRAIKTPALGACLYRDSNPVSTHFVADKERKEMFDLMTHLTHFIYGYMASVVR